MCCEEGLGSSSEEGDNGFLSGFLATVATVYPASPSSQVTAHCECDLPGE